MEVLKVHLLQLQVHFEILRRLSYVDFVIVQAKVESSGPAPTSTPAVPPTPKAPQRETSVSQIPVTPAKAPALQQLSSVAGIDPNKITGTRSETRVKMSRMRLKIAERLKEAQNTCAMLTTFNEIDMRFVLFFFQNLT